MASPYDCMIDALCLGRKRAKVDDDYSEALQKLIDAAKTGKNIHDAEWDLDLKVGALMNEQIEFGFLCGIHLIFHALSRPVDLDK